MFKLSDTQSPRGHRTFSCSTQLSMKFIIVGILSLVSMTNEKTES